MGRHAGEMLLAKAGGGIQGPEGWIGALSMLGTGIVSEPGGETGQLQARCGLRGLFDALSQALTLTLTLTLPLTLYDALGQAEELLGLSHEEVVCLCAVVVVDPAGEVHLS